MINKEPVKEGSRLEMVVSIAIFGLAMFLLTPRYWEPGGESWKQWAAARILSDTGGFPVFSLGPGYAIYLQLFNSLPYPSSIFYEHVVTHLFAYSAIFSMLRSRLQTIPAILLTCAWIPPLATLTPGGSIASIGFLALHFSLGKHSLGNRGYLPPWLCMATLCHSSASTLLFANIVGCAYQKLWKKKVLWNLTIGHGKREIFVWFVKLTFVVIVLLMVFFPSRRKDHNHMLAVGNYMPVSLEDPLNIGFFQIGNWKHILRTVPESELIYQDWYLTNKKTYGGAVTILDAVFKAPKVVMKNLLENIQPAFAVPRGLIFGFDKISNSRVFNWGLGLVSLVAYCIGLLGLISHLKTEGETLQIFTILLGASGFLAALFLVWFASRYLMTLFTLWILVVVYIVPTTSILFSKSRDRWAGVGKLTFSRKNSLFISILAIIVFSTTPQYPFGFKGQVEAVISGGHFLAGTENSSISDANKDLMKSLSKQTKVLALEANWIKAFADVDLDNIYHVQNLPPFDDKSGDVDRFLTSLDVIWVNDALTVKEASISSQQHLRYILHIKPFLSKVLQNGWTGKEVKGFGRIYQRLSQNFPIE